MGHGTWRLWLMVFAGSRTFQETRSICALETCVGFSLSPEKAASELKVAGTQWRRKARRLQGGSHPCCPARTSWGAFSGSFPVTHCASWLLWWEGVAVSRRRS